VTPLHTNFWRKDGADDLVDIHSPGAIFLFRHFLELFVRVAIGRYPNEQGLGQQVHRLFKECLAPRFGTPQRSEAFVAFLVDPDISQVFQGFHTELWSLFKEHAVGDGCYGPPQWVTPEDINAEKYESEEGTHEERQYLKNRCQRRGLGGQQRRVHVRCRMDVTVRVKDVLHILHSAGLVSPPSTTEKFPPYGADIHSIVFPDMHESERRHSLMTPMHDVAGLRDLLGAGSATPPSNADMPTGNVFATSSTDFGNGGESKDPSDTAGMPTSVRSSMQARESSQPSQDVVGASLNGVGVGMGSRLSSPSKLRQSSELASTDVAEAPVSLEAAAPEVPEASDTEVMTCNFKMSMLEVLRLLAESYSSDTVKKLCWAIRGEDSIIDDERVAVLDFVETEVTFCEFERLLLRISEQKTQDLNPDVGQRLPLHRRLQGFLKHILFPALEGRSETAPEPEQLDEERKASKSSAAEGLETADATGVEPSTSDPPAEEVAEATSASLPKEKACSGTELEIRPFEVWRGFDGGDLDGLEEMAAPRIWLSEYETSVVDW
jgi:hypothetical protein